MQAMTTDHKINALQRLTVLARCTFPARSAILSLALFSTVACSFAKQQAKAAAKSRGAGQLTGL
jgi:hypothetical protein